MASAPEEDPAEHIPAISWTRHRSSGVWSPARSSPAIVDAAKVIKAKANYVVVCCVRGKSERV